MELIQGAMKDQKEAARARLGLCDGVVPHAQFKSHGTPAAVRPEIGSIDEEWRSWRSDAALVS